MRWRTGLQSATIEKLQRDICGRRRGAVTALYVILNIYIGENMRIIIRRCAAFAIVSVCIAQVLIVVSRSQMRVVTQGAEIDLAL